MMGSIRARLLVLSAGLTAAALLVAWWWIAALLGDFIERRVLAELDAMALGVMAASEYDETGMFTVSPRPADPRFDAPYSGWYWTVTTQSGEVQASAASLVTGMMTEADRRIFGPQGAELLAYRRTFTAPGLSDPLRVTVTAPLQVVDAERDAVIRPLALALAGLGAALVAAGLGASVLGLRKLDHLRRNLERLRRGVTTSLPDPGVSELRPLVEELNGLIEANRETVSRARTHAGNLAHALKTPLAALTNTATPNQRPMLEQMDRSIRWHLRRAGAAGSGRMLTDSVPIADVVADLALVLSPDAARRGIALSLDPGNDLIFAGEPEDLTEMLGNLLENALNWANQSVSLLAKAGPDGRIILLICDDGPGIPPDRRAALLHRGARLDESQPGSGLGLAIVSDLVRLYRGSLRLDDGPRGGLVVTLDLPGR
ncbi:MULTISPECIES: ATP-binding protein [unclassified Yoonia]|uniref:ATP-binding protein n=1 Tax=unclassified Yoonia TaxID=2629118 RepID=UPI002AFFB674|nr:MULTISPECIES: ATP-binding protein [unclassified Yoonia]